MKNSQLDRLLRFAQRTGDRLIITDSEGKQPVVILSLDEYEKLLTSKVNELEAEPEAEVDLAEIEAAVMAANPELVTPKATKGPVKEEGGEEQFYLEPV